MKDLTQRIAALSPEQRILFEERLKQKGLNSPKNLTIYQREKANYVPLSFAQERLWFLNQLESNIPIYNIVVPVFLKGKLNVKALEDSIKEIVKRHETLRTNFTTIEGQPVQVISDEPKFVLLQQNVPKSDRAIQELITQEQKHSFDLTQESLLRITLVTLNETEYLMLLTTHHIIADAWSRGVLFRELAALYSAFCTGKPSPLLELPIQYADYALWQRDWLQGEVLEKQLNYWQQQLRGELPLLNLPTDRSRSPDRSYQGASASLTLPHAFTQALKDFSRREGVTLFVTLLAAFNVLLHRYTEQEDILIGSPIANRNQAEVENLIGFLVNTLILRGDLSGNPTFREFLGRMREVVLGAIAHQDLPFEKLLETLQPNRSVSDRSPFQVMFSLQNVPEAALAMPDLTLNLLEVENQTAFFDLVFSWQETNGQLTGTLEYNTDLFDAATIERMLGHYQTLLESILANSNCVISSLPMLTELERDTLKEWHQLGSEYPQDTCLHQLFEEWVEKTPDAIAIEFEDRQLTYRQLNQKANQIAHYLNSQGIKPEDKIGLCVDRSLEMVAGILGILKAGGAYVPLDTTQPQERLNFILEDAQVVLVLTQKHLLERFTQTRVQLIALEEISSTQEDSPNLEVTPDNLAYIIYTSGSTGQPKGVLCTHHNVIRLFRATQSWFNFSQHDVWTLFHSIAFDFSVWEMWGALLYGGRLIVVPYWVSRSPEAFYELLAQEEVTVLNQTPSAFRQLIRVEDSPERVKILKLRFVIFGGEALELQSLKPWCDRHSDRSPQLVNMYGITETTVHVTYRSLSIEDIEKNTGSAIGRPIPDLQVYLLDKAQQLVPIGIPGEIYIGGAGLARGYLNRPELTREKFITNPFSNAPEARLYRSGDMARYLPNGELEYLGRIDQQVKIRGFRIELGEIEAVLAGYPDVAEVVVLAREEVSGDKRLVAYVVPRLGNNDSMTTNLRQWLQNKLPDYAIPSSFVLLDALPLTANGKVDRQALPALEPTRPHLEAIYIAPRTPIEKALSEIWSELLNLDRIGIHDNFFELGGHSLLATRLLSRIRSYFEVELPLKSIFTVGFTIAELAKVIRQYQLEGQDDEEIASFLEELGELSDEEALIAVNRVSGES
ncbi:non-ribosomal peptide synthetase [Hydrococcus rivularis]|nr:non-ribosomal peptide synthetase [Hydrococcus rivularis]